MCCTTQGRATGHSFSHLCLTHPKMTIRKFLTLRCESSFVPAWFHHGEDLAQPSGMGSIQIPTQHRHCLASLISSFCPFSHPHSSKGVMLLESKDKLIPTPSHKNTVTSDRGTVPLCFKKTLLFEGATFKQQQQS